MVSPAPSSFEEQLNWKEIDQLAAATLQFSNHCLEYKKLCVTLIVAVPTLLLKLTNDRLDTSVFVAAMLIAVSFLVVDAQAYYYQELLRATMRTKAEKVRAIRQEQALIAGVGMPLTNRSAATRRWRSFVNPSQMPYYILLIVDGVVWLMYINQLIR